MLKESDADCFGQGSRSMPSSPHKVTKSSDKINLTQQLATTTKKHHHYLKSAGFHSAHSSPVRTVSRSQDSTKLTEEQWIDGPRISKSKVAEARNVQLMRKDIHSQKTFEKREKWVDGPMKRNFHDLAYGFMDSHKKTMIKKWVENQSLQLQNRLRNSESDKKNQQYRAFTLFKTCADDDMDNEDGRGQGSGQEEDERENSKTADLAMLRLQVENEDLSARKLFYLGISYSKM